MSQTVIGFFDDAQEAQTAVERLQEKGISRDRIDMSRGRGATGSTDYDTLSTSSNSDGVTGNSRTAVDADDNAVERTAKNTGNAISNFFKSLFGDDDDDNRTERYSRVAANSGAIVTVHAQSREEAEDAADVLDDCGAVDVDERADQYESQGASGTYAGNDLSERTYVATEAGSRTNDDTDRSLDNEQNLNRTAGEKSRMRSRIMDRPVDETVRLRDSYTSGAHSSGTNLSGTNTDDNSNTGSNYRPSNDDGGIR